MDLQLLEIDSNIRYTQLFKKALQHCRSVTQINNIYCLLKIIIGLTLAIISICRGCNYDNLDVWLLLVVVQSILGFACYSTLLKYMKTVPILLKVAEDLHQAVYIHDGFQPLSEEEFLVPPSNDPTIEIPAQEESRRTSYLATQIKAEISNKNQTLKWSGNVAFLFNQALIIWGFVIEFMQPRATLQTQYEECKGGILIYLFIFLLLSVYQYLDIYILLILLIICLPFILIFLVYSKIKQKNDQSKAMEQVKSMLRSGTIKYEPEKVQGDPECRICFSAYSLHEEIVKLPCSEMHHFHKTCITAWMQVSQSCPLCRKNLIPENDN